MAKDGTRRGGARIGAGRKKKSLDEKIIEGKFRADNSNAEISAFEIPPPREYLSAEQKIGGKTHAAQIYAETYEWLKACGCAEIISPQLVENYSQMVARHIQCEELLTSYGMLAKHPTTGEPVTSPFVKMSLEYLKSANQMWYQIFQVVKESGKREIGIGNSNDMMERLLRRVK